MNLADWAHLLLYHLSISLLAVGGAITLVPDMHRFLVSEQQWLTGDRLGWRGPWGTTYPSNLRLALSRLSEDEWVHNARTLSYRPPMPWFALRDMDETDLRAFYRFVRALGPAGEPAPAWLPPGAQAQGMAVVFPSAGPH